MVGKPVEAVTPAYVLGFIAAQRTGAACLTVTGVVAGVGDEPAGVSLRTVRRRLSTVSGLYVR